MTVLAQLLMYIIAGLVQDVLIVQYYISITRLRTIQAPVLGALLTVLTVGVYEGLITSRSIPFVLAFALGTGLGTRLGMGRGHRATSTATENTNELLN